MSCLANDRRLRVQYPDAIYHVMSRGVQRSPIYLGDDDRHDFFGRCEDTVHRFGWQVLAVTQMTNHFHLMFRTPEPNLCRGAQYLLGTYAQAFNRRHGRSGHVFEGRYCCRVIENETYFWNVSRYAHLNPVPDLVEHPALWPWSSYLGFCDDSLRLPWVDYDQVLRAWSGDFGGAVAAYRQYVEQGLVISPEEVSPQLIDGWILGSEAFAERIRRIASPASNEPTVVRVRNNLLPLEVVVAAVCEEFRIPPENLARKSSRHPARPLLAYVAREQSTATLQQIAQTLGLARRDSVPTLLKRVKLASRSAEIQLHAESIRTRLTRQST